MKKIISVLLVISSISATSSAAGMLVAPYYRSAHELNVVMENADVANKLRQTAIKSIKKSVDGTITIATDACAVNIKTGYKTRMDAMTGNISVLSVSKATCK